MNRQFYERNINYLKFQRNIFASLAFLLASCLFLTCCFLFLKRERVIIAPPIIEKEFWVDRHNVSSTYLEQYGYFLGQLLLGKSSYSAPSQRKLLLRHTDPKFSGILQRKLIDEEELLQRQNATYTFFPTSIRVKQDTNEVLLEGDRVFYVGGKQVSSEKEGYVLSFNFTGSRLLLSGITALENRERNE